MRDTIDMAREAGLFTHKEVQAELKAFEALVRADERSGCAEQYLRIMRNAVVDAVEIEREACAKVCDEVHREYDGEEVSASWIATAIRARGNT